MKSLEKGPAFPLLALRACDAMGASDCSIPSCHPHIRMICGCAGTQTLRRAVGNSCRDNPAAWHSRRALNTNSCEKKKRKSNRRESRGRRKRQCGLAGGTQESSSASQCRAKDAAGEKQEADEVFGEMISKSVPFP